MSRDFATSRRALLKSTALGLAGLAASPWLRRSAASQADDRKPSRFQVACMTLPYSAFPMSRALEGLRAAGYRYVAWGTTHQEGAGRVPALDPEAPPGTAKVLAARCRDLGLEPLMMFGPSPEALDALKLRVRQASAAGVGQVLTMGSTRGNDLALWARNFRELGPFAGDHGVTVVVKPHGGNTGTGAALAAVTREVNHDHIKISYDAGNVMDYHDIDPLPDFATCVDEVRGLCVKDHRNTPKDQDCGPGLGEIDHYKLLGPLAFTGRDLPLCCENIGAPLLPFPKDPAEIDALARRAREFLELVIRGVQA